MSYNDNLVTDLLLEVGIDPLKNSDLVDVLKAEFRNKHHIISNLKRKIQKLKEQQLHTPEVK